MHCASASTSRCFNRAVAISQLNVALCIWPEANLLPVDAFCEGKFKIHRNAFSLFGRGSAPDPAGGAYSAHQPPIAGLRGGETEGKGMGEAEGSRPGEDKAERN